MEAQSTPGAEPLHNNAPSTPMAVVTSEMASSAPVQCRNQVGLANGNMGSTSNLSSGFVSHGWGTHTEGVQNVSKSPEIPAQLLGSEEIAPIGSQSSIQASKRPRLSSVGSAENLALSSSAPQFSPLSEIIPSDTFHQSQGFSGVQNQNQEQKRSIEWEEVPHGGVGAQTEAKQRRQSVQLAPPDWLPPGWTVFARTRESGKSAGITDKVLPHVAKLFVGVEIKSLWFKIELPLYPNKICLSCIALPSLPCHCPTRYHNVFIYV